MDLFSAAVAFVKGDFVTTARTLGLQPGQSIVLRGIVSEATANVLGASPFEAGRLAGRRICTYAIAPTVLRNGKQLAGKLRAARTLAAATPGSSPLNPLKGSIVAEASSADSASPPSDQVLPGRWISTPKGPVRIGPKLGAGKFGTVYELPDAPGKVIKVGKGHANTRTSFAGQIEGFNLLRSNGIPTPAIDAAPPVPADENPVLFEDDVHSQWPGARILNEVPDPQTPERQAIGRLYQQIGNKGLIWVDGNPSNIFVFPSANGLAAGVVDADMVFPANALKAQPQIVQGNLINLLSQAGRMPLLFQPLDANQIMQILFDLRYPQ